MRKELLLASTALIALGSVSAMAADVNISGSYEMLYKSVDDNGVTTDQDEISSSSELDISFSETLDNGMTMSLGFGFSGAKDDSNFTLGGTPMGTIRITDMDDDAVEGLDIDVDGYTPEEGRRHTNIWWWLHRHSWRVNFYHTAANDGWSDRCCCNV